MIRQPNYEVGPEFVDALHRPTAPRTQRFFAPSRERAATPCSISPATSRRGLPRAGIRQVEDLGRCTYADADTFYSYRRSVHRNEADYGRHINAIALAD